MKKETIIHYTMLAPTILISLALLALAFLALAVRVIFHRSHRFPETSVGHNAKLRAKGLRCPRQEDAALHSPGQRACEHCGVDLLQRAREE